MSARSGRESDYIIKLIWNLAITIFATHYLNAIHCRIIGAATFENVPTDMCAQWRLKSSRTSAQPDQSLRCLHAATLYHWLSKLRPGTVLIRLRKWWPRISEGTLTDVAVRIIFITVYVQQLHCVRKNLIFSNLMPTAETQMMLAF